MTYEPTSRRPIANFFRKTGRGATNLCIRWNVHPDAISSLSIVFSAAAAVCFWQSGNHPWLLLLAPALCYVRLWCNMLDGMVALAASKASRRGEILNELPDRVSDLLIFVGVAHSGLCSPISAYWAAIMALFTAYVGTLGQAVGARREFGGLMSKPWRMALLHLGAWVFLGIIWFGDGRLRFGGLTILDWTCLVIVLGCVQTIAVRLTRIFRELRRGAAS
ncbi:MAG: CDP-alcohol phosphatidyltransferase family protein [Planctomycetes bacterium]|nr:CDP-alcohol phosphatidyltransferase family protein [Planctomycetota bacterium]